MAPISTAVSATASSRPSGTGGPTLTVTRGGCWRAVTLGTFDDRGQTRSVPHRPDGDDRCAGLGGQPGRAGVADQDRVEERLAPGNGPLGEDDDHLAGPQGGGGPAHRVRRAAAPVDLDAAQGPGQAAHHGGVEHLLLGHEPHRPAQAGGHDPDGGHVEVAPVVGGQQHRAGSAGCCSMPSSVEPGVGEGLGPEEGPDQVVGLEARPPTGSPGAGPSTRAATAGPGPPPPAGGRR